MLDLGDGLCMLAVSLQSAKQRGLIKLLCALFHREEWVRRDVVSLAVIAHGAMVAG